MSTGLPDDAPANSPAITAPASDCKALDRNRHGMPKLPPGQRAVTNWPVLDLGVVPQIAVSEWRLEIDGLVERAASYSWEEFLVLPQTDDVFAAVKAKSQ